MADFSISEAAGAGFRIIARKPLAVLTWGLLIWAVMIPILLLFASIFSLIAAGVQEEVRQAAAGPAAVTAAGDTNALSDANSALNAATNEVIGPGNAAAAPDATNAAVAAGGAGGKPAGDTAYGRNRELPPEVAMALGRMFLLYPVIIIGALVVSGVLMGAVFRAVLEPDDSSFAYLRVGMREVWLVLVNFVMRLLIGFATMPIVFVAMIIGVAVTVMAAASSPSGPGEIPPQLPMIFGIVWFLAIMGAIAIQLWLGMRLIMGLPMSFDHNQFRLFESWSFTRGHTWKLVGLLLLLVGIGIVIEIVVVGICFAIVAGVAGAVVPMNPDQWRSFFQHPPANWSTLALTVGGGVSLLIALVAGFANAIFLAPWADAYRQLRDSGASSTPQYVPHVGEARPIS